MQFVEEILFQFILELLVELSSPYSSPLGVIIQHAVLVMPNDVLRWLAHDFLNDALELDGAAPFVELLQNGLIPLVNDMNLRS